jgi:outer membrane protein OmpA-like peptidoglycan-associated protein
LKKNLFFIAIFSFCLFSLLHAVGGNAGTTNTNFLKIPPFARPAAMGEAFTAQSEGTFGLFYNPAGICMVPQYEVQATHIEWFQGLRYEALAFVMPPPFLEIGKMGLAFSWFQVDEMARTDELSSYDYSYLNSGLDYGSFINYYFAPYDYSILAGYALDLREDISAGINIKYSAQTIDTYSGGNFAADLGFLYRYMYEGTLIRFGASVANVGTDLKLNDLSFGTAKQIRLGAADTFNLFGNKFTFATQAVFQTDYEAILSTGAEYWLFDILALRAGYKFLAFTHPTFGAGINFSGFEFDYAFMNYEELGNTHRFSLLYRFGTPPVKLKVSPYLFSPNNDNFLDTIKFLPAIKETQAVKSAKILIYGASSQPVSEINIRPEEASVQWGGKVGELALPDGVYRAKLVTAYESGTAASEPAAFEIDNTPPVAQVVSEPKLLRPGKSTALLIPATFNLSASDRNKVAKWQLVVWDKDKKPFHNYVGNGPPPAMYVWDGKGSDNRYVDTGELYYYSLYATDSVGNVGRSPFESVVILLREIKLTFSSDALFDLGEADVKISAYNILREMKSVINKHPDSDIVVAGYTDNLQPMGGKYKNNKALSKARAEAVKFFMVNLLNIDEERIKTEGYGEENPIFPNDSPENRQKNRRVEIIIKSTIYK